MHPIVPIAPEHVNGLRRALESVVREGRYLAMQEPPSLIEVVMFVDMLAKRGCPQRVALDGKRVIGWCDIRPKMNDTTTGILGMGVIAEFRRQGVGRALLDACLAASPFDRVELSVFASNANAIALYIATGFTVRYGEACAADTVMMIRDAPPPSPTL